jgi:hypothetical protein
VRRLYAAGLVQRWQAAVEATPACEPSRKEI